jgi:hypothetical protein
MQPAQGLRKTDEWAGQTATDMLQSDQDVAQTGEQDSVPVSSVVTDTGNGSSDYAMDETTDETTGETIGDEVSADDDGSDDDLATAEESSPDFGTADDNNDGDGDYPSIELGTSEETAPMPMQTPSYTPPAPVYTPAPSPAPAYHDTCPAGKVCATRAL